MLSERKSKDGIRMWCRYDYHNCTSPCAADRTCMRLEDIGTTGRGKEEERLLFDEAFFGVCGLVVVLLSIQAVERADPVTVSCQ